MKEIKKRDLISIQDLSKADVLGLLQHAGSLKKKPTPTKLRNKIMVNAFWEPSTRTKLSFESAMLRMGGSCLDFSDVKSSSVAKGEDFADTVKTLDLYGDVLILRHPKEGSARIAADLCEVPVINAGDGANQHPTQTLLDLFTMKEACGSLEGLHVGIVGDLKYGRTVHSLALAASLFGMRLFFVNFANLGLPQEILDQLSQKKIKHGTYESLEEIIPKVDVLYMTRAQKERFKCPSSEGLCNDNLSLRLEHLERAQPHLKVLHPMPRGQEIDRAVDSTPFAYYFQQSKNGIYTRQAILDMILNFW